MLQHTARQPTKAAIGAPAPRLRAKGQVGPQFYRQNPPAPRQSAVERLEADKAKYVKSQVALSKQQPIRPTELHKPKPVPAVRTTRIVPVNAAQTKVDVVQLDLEHLSNLISDVAESPRITPITKEKPLPPPRPDRSSPAKVRLKAARAEGAGGAVWAPAAGAVRRVDVVPQASPQTSPCRPLQFMRQPLKPMTLHAQVLLRPAAPHLRPFHAKPPLCTPLKPAALPKSDDCPPCPIDPPSAAAFPPPSPAITRLSSTSSRKRPSLTRSKSDMSDRYSRAGTELERFFNLCGVDPDDLQELTGSNADIVSLARFRSVSAPGSECSGSRRGEVEEEERDEDEAGKAAERVPYGVSVIERNARVIKWLYGLRQAKDNTTKSTNL
ncbi:hypothetical protein OJAV_G00068980 [Oryzias javanicus]|uniref:Centrosome-associated FAM110 C-terminal domain-containing protein n=1 Tax=Oryzias javanicus TaxID=123683 RepID=A0A3S2N097_ORYJA|nr:hypothetical protein OJAV_G00068980 [Oryzias javanicus]